ncbi:MAG: hypothetical protein ABIS35_13825 [Terracoccus sp.]
MDCAAVLSKSRPSILDESFSVVDRSHLHYESAGEELTRERLAMLFDLVVGAIDSRDLSEVTGYAGTVARERFGQGYDIGDVQAAFNALEESMWRHVVASTDLADLAEATGLLSTVLGAGKDVLARTYVSLATRRHVGSLDLTAMFAGTQAHPQPESAD